ncbi:hypothetical protein CYLTODRAFT_423558 [Cylindrobasidium torrendii FP15055 ss-10]|uniref:AAA-ATPase-like domain-containing protein n=1 Tax=Cylindrobasidium torrendii FP15055 ss-10 TaxID=1314674 RepID=A0A0D7B717_9AGAR|nr:hypothetical protein CYLTODRAFT_423558 [Cylindrobasidium torrendii FP15055 ss-10]
MIFLTRLLLLEQFLLSSSSSDTMETRRLWLCWQLHSCLLSDDLFKHERALEDAKAICDVENSILDAAIADVLSRVLSSLPSGHLFIVIDDANKGTDPSQTFLALKPPQHVPMLKQILREWRRHTKDLNVTYIVSGVRIELDEFSPKDPVSADFSWFSGTGSFDDLAKQEDYVRQFLPADFADSIDGANFVRRVARFFRGRHTNTAHLMADIVRHGLQNPHGVLTANICRMARLESKMLDGFELPSRYESVIQGYPPYNGVSYKPFVVSTMHDALLIYLAIGDRPLRFYGPQRSLVSLVSAGVGYFVDDDLQEVAIEPAYMLSISSYFQKLNFDMLDPAMFIERARAPHKTARPALALVALTLARVLTAPTRVVFSRRFTFLGSPASWANKRARIICPSTSASWAPYTFEPGKSIIHSADNRKDIGRWFKAGRNVPFCLYKPTTAAPVLLFAVSFEGSKSIWVALSVLLADYSSRIEVLDALRTTLPDDVLKTFTSSSKTSGAVADKKNFLFQLPNRRKKDLGDYSILRVVVPLGARKASHTGYEDYIRGRIDFPAAVMYPQRDHVLADCTARVDDVIARVIDEIPLLEEPGNSSTSSELAEDDSNDQGTPSTTSVPLEDASPVSDQGSLWRRVEESRIWTYANHPVRKAPNSWRTLSVSEVVLPGPVVPPRKRRKVTEDLWVQS